MTREARRAQIMAVARDLFAREGYHHVAMDDIAERAQISKPVLYRHFTSKLDLYLAVVDQRGEALVAAITQALASVEDGATNGRSMVRAIVASYVQFVEDAGESFSLLFESDVTRDTDVRQRVESASAQAAKAICTGLHELAGLPPAQADLLSAALVGMARVAATSRYRSAQLGSAQVDVDQTIDLITQVAWRGVAGLVKERPEPRG
jgi:AcrR family transcriptional regulator